MAQAGDRVELEDGRIVVRQGDITGFEGDVVVNAANSSLLGGGGVDGAIHRAGGPDILSECRRIRNSRYPDGLPTGGAVATTAGSLPAKAIIHTVGPVWSGGNSGEPGLLRSCYVSSLNLAREMGFDSIAFPAISTGVYGYPKPEAARIVFETLVEYVGEHRNPRTIHLVFFSQRDMLLFLETNECQ